MSLSQLGSVGTMLSADDFPKDFVDTPELYAQLTTVLGCISRTPSKPVLITGARGVGKSKLMLEAARRIQKRNWHVFLATAQQIVAGNIYIGEFEGAVKDTLNSLTELGNALWLVPAFQEFDHIGKHKFSVSSILDLVMPKLKDGSVKMIAEISESALEKMVRSRPDLANIFEIVRVNPTTEQQALEMAQKWLALTPKNPIFGGLGAPELQEAIQLVNEYYTSSEMPGSLFELLKQTAEKAKQHAVEGITTEHLLNTISKNTGLPMTVLGDNQKLDLEELTRYFSSRVIGQEDAVKTLVERIAMIKAGLTDPGRPLGVFLFVGPTGTGKTEIAKTLASYLFGSKDRLIRLDMSEFQTVESLFRLTGESGFGSDNVSLVSNIRRHPFSVVLLDEFEKSHPNIWDFFLQVFDDARLTDQSGNVADFRNTIIIMTSNLGVSLPTANRIGFNPADSDRINDSVLEQISATFRPEFVNRIDKVVVFNPLTKAVARQILKAELQSVLTRKGLRRRKWELDFEESALDFLLEQGFSQTLGARPLRRAIEKHLLAPLAITIVNHNFPKGNQFLLVSAGKQRLKVEFIDPDEPEYTWDQKKKRLESQEEKAKVLNIKSLVAGATGQLAEFRVIEQALDQAGQLYEALRVEPIKSGLLEQMKDHQFWNSPDRFGVLSQIELYDRFSHALDSLRNLYNRLHDPEKERLTYDSRLLNRLAVGLYHLQLALDACQQNTPQDAWLRLRFSVGSAEYGERLMGMYEQWGKVRNVSLKQMGRNEHEGEVSVYYTATGLGAYPVLLPETGYHTFEVPIGGEGKAEKTEKHRVGVAVLPMTVEDYRLKSLAPLVKRFDVLKEFQPVRRYMLKKKSPLVKDLLRNEQTGRLDLVLGGYFDVVWE